MPFSWEFTLFINVNWPTQRDKRFMKNNYSILKSFLLLTSGIILLYSSCVVCDKVITLKSEYKLTVTQVKEGIPPQVVLATTALGGFRGIFIDLLWLRAMKQKEEGNFYEMVQIYDWITNLQPNYSNVWKFIGWDLAYNVSVEINNLEDRWFWVKRGIQYIRNKGSVYNRYDPELCLETSWIFHHKIGGNLDYANRFYRKELIVEMQNIFGGPADREFLRKIVSIPDDKKELLKDDKIRMLVEKLVQFKLDPFTDLAKINQQKNSSEDLAKLIKEKWTAEALEKIRLLHIKQRIINELNMDPEFMLELSNKYGDIDWRGCDSHSLYWACKGLDISHRLNQKDRVNLKYERLIYFSLIEMVKRGKVQLADTGISYTLPDYRFFYPAREMLKNLIDRGETGLTPTGRDVNLTGVYSGYMSFLRTAVYMFYFNGMLKDAQNFLGYMHETRPDVDMYKLPLKEYVATEIKEYVGDMNMDSFAALLEANLRQYFWNLALGNIEEATGKMKWAKFLHQYGLKRWPQVPGAEDQFVGAVPPFSDIRNDLLIRILRGQDPMFPEYLISSLKEKLPADMIKNAENMYKRKQLKLNQNNPSPKS